MSNEIIINNKSKSFELSPRQWIDIIDKEIEMALKELLWAETQFITSLIILGVVFSYFIEILIKKDLGSLDIMKLVFFIFVIIFFLLAFFVMIYSLYNNFTQLKKEENIEGKPIDSGKIISHIFSGIGGFFIGFVIFFGIILILSESDFTNIKLLDYKFLGSLFGIIFITFFLVSILGKGYSGFAILEFRKLKFKILSGKLIEHNVIYNQYYDIVNKKYRQLLNAKINFLD